MSRGLRNNNPGNIRLSAVRYRGEIVPSADPAFKQFKTIAWGYRALFMLLHTYQKKHGLKTLRSMIPRYAPSAENDTGNYLKTVCNWAGIPADRVLNTLDEASMIPVAAAISRMENGIQPDNADLRAGWNLFIQTPDA